MSMGLQVKQDENIQLAALRRIAMQQTPLNEIRVREASDGSKWKYTDGPYVIRILNQAFGWDWDFVADHEELLMNGDKPFEVKVRGTLTVRLNGQAVTKTQYGCQPIKMLRNGSAPVTIGDCYKGAATDALKKCASLLGIALDLYDSDYKAEKYAEEPAAAREEQLRQYGPPPEPVRSIKLEGVQPTSPADELRALCHKLGYDDAKLLKWLVKKFGLSTIGGREVTLDAALDSLGDGEMSQAIDIFREKVEAK